MDRRSSNRWAWISRMNNQGINDFIKKFNKFRFKEKSFYQFDGIIFIPSREVEPLSVGVITKILVAFEKGRM